MAAVWFCTRARVRSSLRGTLALAVLAGLASAVVLATAAGARRTDSAYPRMLDATNAAEVLVSPNGDGTGTDGFYEAIEQVNGVRAIAPLVGVPLLFVEGPHADGMIAGPSMAPLDGRLASDVARMKVLSGRMWHPTAVDELVVNRFFVDEFGLGAGDAVRFAIPRGFDDDDPETMDFRIVGEVATAQDIVPFTDLDGAPSAIGTPALAEGLAPEQYGFEGAMVDLEPGADAGAFIGAVEALAVAHSDTVPDGIFTVDLAANVEQVERSIRPLTLALVIFAGVMALVVIVVLGQAIRRFATPAAREVESLAAIGFVRGERRIVRMLHGAVIGTVAAVVAVAGSVVGSAFFPIGPARLAEIDPGISFDAVVLVPGFVLVLALCVTAALLAGRAPAEGVTPVVAARVAKLKVGPAAAVGLRAAWPSRLRDGGAVIAIATGAITAVLASFTFAASLDDLVGTKVRYGQAWDRMVDGQFGPAPLGEVLREFGDDDRIEALAVGDYGQVVVGERTIPAISWETLHGNLDIVTLDGRPAYNDGEIALGGETMAQLGVSIGDVVEADTGDGPTELLVVGRAVFPRLGLGSFATTSMGEGAQLAVGALSPLSLEMPEEMPAEMRSMFEGNGGRVHNFIALDVADNASVDAELAELAVLGEEVVGEVFLYRTNQRPTTISDLTRVRSLPALLAAAIAAVAVGTLAHALASSLHGRRRELAVLSAIGFDRAQLAATVLWHALTIAGVAALVALPLGTAAGRVAWTAFADQVHAASSPVVPAIAFGAAVAAAVAVGAIVAAPFAVRAGRTRAGVALRTE